MRVLCLRSKLMLRKISIILALLGLAINFYISALYNGVTHGIRLGEEESMFSGYGSIWDSLSYFHFLMAFCFFVLVIAKSIKKEVLSQLIALFSLLPALYLCKEIYLLKSSCLYFLDLKSFNGFFRSSFQLDWLWFSIICMLIIFQIIAALKFYSERHHKIS